MSSMYAIWHALLPYRDFIVLTGVVLTFAKIAWDVWRGASFITKVLSDATVGWINAAAKMGSLLRYAPSLIVDFKGQRLCAARYIAELEILRPRARPPKPRDYQPHEFNRIFTAWAAEEMARRSSISALIRQHFNETRTGLWRSIGRGIKSLSRNSRQAMGRSESTTVVPIDDFPSLDDSRIAIKRYFDVLESMGYRDAKFVSTAQLEVGYLAPLFLITGLINRFTDEDGWKLILNNYRHLVQSDEKYSTELRELRSFLFNCWLLWGPSIAPCSCPLWIPKNPACKNDLTIQYGFGDENNSIDIVVKNGRGVNFATGLENRLNPSPKEMASDADFTPIALCAAPYRVKGTFRWGPKLKDDEISDAQRFIQGGAASARKPLNGRIVLECREGDVEIADASDSPKYYSAYLWIMFVISDSDGKPHFPQRWKNVLVYFEHGNIADATTYQTLKENLISKVCSSLTEILSRKSDDGRVAIRYACAFDDSYCGPKDGVLFSPHQGLAGAQGASAYKKARLVDILRQATSKLGTNHPLTSGRLCLPETPRPSAPNEYGSCQLPEIIEEFYGALQVK